MKNIGQKCEFEIPFDERFFNGLSCHMTSKMMFARVKRHRFDEFDRLWNYEYIIRCIFVFDAFPIWIFFFVLPSPNKDDKVHQFIQFRLFRTCTNLTIAKHDEQNFCIYTSKSTEQKCANPQITTTKNGKNVVRCCSKQQNCFRIPMKQFSNNHENGPTLGLFVFFFLSRLCCE